MAINIRRVTGYILNKNPDKHNKDLWFDSYSRYIRLTIGSRTCWYYVSDAGFIVDRVQVDGDLEAVYKESNGFLEQLELF